MGIDRQLRFHMLPPSDKEIRESYHSAPLKGDERAAVCKQRGLGTILQLMQGNGPSLNREGACQLMQKQSVCREHSKKKSTSKNLFLVLQNVTNRGVYSVPGRTKWYLEAPWQAYWGPQDSIQYLEGPNGIWKHHDRHNMCIPDTIWSWTPICLSRCFQIPFGPSRYWIEAYLWQSEAPKKVLWSTFCSWV